MNPAPKLKRHQMLRVKSREALEKRYKVTVKSIGHWLNEGAPRKKGGYYNLKDWDAWVEKYKSAESGKDDTLATVTLQLKQADLRETLRLEKALSGKTVDAEEVRQQAFAAAKQITSTLLRIPPQLGSILGVEAQRRSQVIVEEALNILKENPLGEVKT